MLYVQIFIAVALAISIAAFIYTQFIRQPGGSRPRPAKREPTKAPAGAKPRFNASALLDSVLSLQRKGAQWPEILSSLNPDGDGRITELLAEIRGPHMFVPHTALAVIESGCRKVAPQATAVEALQAARDSMEKVVRFGD